MRFRDRLAVAPNSFVDPDIGAQATQKALLKNLYSARLYGWRVRAPLKGPDDPALYQIVKEWNKANGTGASGVLNLLTLKDMKTSIAGLQRQTRTGRPFQPVPVEIDLSTYTPYGVLTDEQLAPDDREYRELFGKEEQARLDSLMAIERIAQNRRNQNWQLKKNLMWGAAALGAVGLVFFLRRRK
jgi:hypothetical protein